MEFYEIRAGIIDSIGRFSFAREQSPCLKAFKQQAGRWTIKGGIHVRGIFGYGVRESWVSGDLARV